jgi:hypothetical protein
MPDRPPEGRRVARSPAPRPGPCEASSGPSSPRRHGQGPGAEGPRAGDVVGRVPHDPHALGGKVDAPVAPGPAQGVGPELVADLAVVGEGPDREKVPQAMEPELGLRSAAQVAREEALGDVGALGGLPRMSSTPAGSGRRFARGPGQRGDVAVDVAREVRRRVVDRTCEKICRMISGSVRPANSIPSNEPETPKTPSRAAWSAFMPAPVEWRIVPSMSQRIRSFLHYVATNGLPMASMSSMLVAYNRVLNHLELPTNHENHQNFLPRLGRACAALLGGCDTPESRIKRKPRGLREAQPRPAGPGEGRPDRGRIRHGPSSSRSATPPRRRPHRRGGPAPGVALRDLRGLPGHRHLRRATTTATGDGAARTSTAASRTTTAIPPGCTTASASRSTRTGLVASIEQEKP